MIKLSLKGFAKYIVSSPSVQRRILQDFKYPAADEPFAMRLYYREAKDCLRACVRDGQTKEWLRQQAIAMTVSRTDPSPASIRRLRQNAEAVLLLEKYFAGKAMALLDVPRIRLNYYGVSISVVADLRIRDGAKDKLFKLQFGGKPLPEQSVKVMTQCMFEAGLSNGLDLLPASAIYIDLPRDDVYTASRAGKKTLCDIKAACETISQIWDSIPPPARSKRKAA